MKGFQNLVRQWRTNALACALVLAVAFCAADVSAQTIRARADGLLEVTDAPPGTVVRYTLDGTDPTRDAGVWLDPVDVPAGYTVKARSFTADHTPVGAQVEWASRAIGERIASTLVPVTQGYEVWATAMEPTLTRLLSR